MSSKFIISLDFELFWGVSASKKFSSYRKKIEETTDSLPLILNLFKEYDIHSTWAIVGMMMCENYNQWKELRPSIYPSYDNSKYSNYLLDQEVKSYPELFFCRKLINMIKNTCGQEIGCHSYSHFYCTEPGSTLEQFEADLFCAKTLGTELGINLDSYVFPRNQSTSRHIQVLKNNGFKVYRGNPKTWLYKDGHNVKGGILGRGIRYLDAFIPLSGSNFSMLQLQDGIINCPASFFLRAKTGNTNIFSYLHLHRIKKALLKAAITGSTFHLWWHPHNFGANIDENIDLLKDILEYYSMLSELYKIKSYSMIDYATEILNENSSTSN